MKFNTALTVTSLVWTVLSAPIPIVLIRIGDITSDRPTGLGAHPPAPVRLDQLTPEFLQKVGIPADIRIDNRPIQPSKTDDPSVVLAADRPVATSYLMSLTGHKYAGLKPSHQKLPEPEDDGFIVIDAMDLPKEAIEAIRASSIAQMELGFRERMIERVGRMPCYHLRRDSNDTLIIGAVVVFVLLVVVMEVWDAVRQSGACPFNRRRGQIRLHAEEPATMTEKRGLSIQASALPESAE